MIGLEEIRGYAMAMPEVTEGTHFRLPAFKVGEKGFVVLQKGDTHAIVSVDEAQAKAAAAEDPDAYEAVWRNKGRIFVGVRVDLARAASERFRELWDSPGGTRRPSAWWPRMTNVSKQDATRVRGFLTGHQQCQAMTLKKSLFFEHL